jgi:hypothetical protein
MSMTFSLEHMDGPTMNLSNVNAVDLLLWLGYRRHEMDTNGIRLRAGDLAARCRRRLWPEARNVDPGHSAGVDSAPGRATLIDCGRPAGYLKERTAQLLELAELAGDGHVLVD